MNEMDQLTRFRDGVPVGVTPRAEQLFRAALREEHQPARPALSRSGRRLRGTWPAWRLGIAASAAAALVAGILVAVLPSSAPVVLSARLLADRASAAALAQPAVSPGQWVYRVVESQWPSGPKGGGPKTFTEAGWETADGGVTYGDNYSLGVDTGDNIPGYDQIGSLPASPAALDAYLARLGYPDSKPTPVQQDQAAFFVINDMLINYVLPPRLEAEVYQALAAIPIVTVDSNVTAIDGQAGVAFVLPPTPQSEQSEIILNASSYQFLADASWDNPSSAATRHETAVVQMVIVGAPGSTQPSLTPPTAAELLAEQADRAVTFTNTPPLLVKPGTWVRRELATSTGDQTVWATADDSAQASYVHGKLQVCSRTQPCASSTHWLMPAGPGYTLVNPPLSGGPSLPSSLSQLLAALNTYGTGCTDVAGDCNAVNALANVMFGYANRGGPNGNWFLLLAGIPGVTVKHVTDVTGQADLAFSYPFTSGITEILFNASTGQLAGYVRDGAETVVTKQLAVSGPGSSTPAGRARHAS